MKLITGNSHPDLAESVAKLLQQELVKCDVTKFSNTEISVKINESIRNEDIYIIQTGGFDDNNSVNDYLMETLTIMDACKRSNVKSITLVLPCYPYARQDKKDSPRVPISAKLVINLFQAVGINRLISVDLHASQIQGFADYAFDNLYTVNILCKYIKEQIFEHHLEMDKMPEDKLLKIQKNYMLVAPDNGGTKRIMKFSSKLRINNVIMHKQRDYTTNNKVDKTILIGEHDLTGKTAIIVDDMADTMGTMIKAIDTLVENGVVSVIIVVVHGVFSGKALERIAECDKISRVITTNSLPQDENIQRCSKIEIVDISKLLADVMMAIETGGSIAAFFE